METDEIISIFKEAIKVSTIDDISELRNKQIIIKNKLLFKLEANSDGYILTNYHIEILTKERDYSWKKIEIESDEYDLLKKLINEKIDELFEEFLKNESSKIISFPQPPEELKNQI